MGDFVRMQMADKGNLCKNIYSNEVLKSADCLKEYEKYARVGGKVIPVTCYTNFRDSLFHFRKLMNSSEEQEIMQQAFAIKEHLGRARTDAKTSVLMYYSKVAEELISRDDINDELKKQIRVFLHQMKNAIMMNRIEGMMMSEVVINKYTDDDISAIMKDFFDLMQEKCIRQFKETNKNMEKNGNCIVVI